jgi:hypothetical protein
MQRNDLHGLMRMVTKTTPPSLLARLHMGKLTSTPMPYQRRCQSSLIAAAMNNPIIALVIEAKRTRSLNTEKINGQL